MPIGSTTVALLRLVLWTMCRGAAILFLIGSANASPEAVSIESLIESSAQRFAALYEANEWRYDGCSQPVFVIEAGTPQTAGLAQKLRDAQASCVIVESSTLTGDFLADVIGNSSLDFLQLEGLERLDSLQLDHLLTYGGRQLHLDGLTSLPTEQAAALFGAGTTSLSFGSLEEMSPATLEQISTWDGANLYLRGVKAFGREHAAALGDWRCNELALGAASLDKATAAMLPRCYTLELHVQQLDANQAEAVASRPTSQLHLPGLKTLSVATAAKLATGSFAFLRLDGLTTLDAGAAVALTKMSADVLILDGLTSVSPTLATVLGQSELRWISLSGVASFDAETAGALVSNKEGTLQLVLNGLASLPPETAAAFAKTSHAVLFELRGLDHLDLELATSLGALPSRSLDVRVQTFDADPRVFSAFKGARLEIPTPHLDASQAKAVAAWSGESLELPHLREVDEATAAALASSTAQRLNIGLSVLDPKTAVGLRRFSGEHVHLTSMGRVDVRTAKALAAWGTDGSRLTLRVNTRLDRATWRILAKGRGDPSNTYTQINFELGAR